MKVYISGPMTGIDDLNKPAFMAAENELFAAGYEVANPARIEIYEGEHEDYMRADLAMLVTCDRVVVLPGWEQSRGSFIEMRTAWDLKIPIVYYETWLQASPEEREELMSA